MKIKNLNEGTQLMLFKTDVNGTYYSCMDCEWEGELIECDFDTEYDQFKGIDKKFPICPKCGGGLDY